MGLFWDLYQQSQISQHGERAGALEARVHYLEEELRSQRRHLYDLRFQLATRQLTDHTQLAQTRRTIARILTVATERQAAPAKEAAPAVPAAARARRRPAATAAARGGNR